MPAAARTPALLVLDFDGTIAERDVGDALCDRFAPPAWRDIDAAWVSGALSLPEAQRRMWALARATEEAARAHLPTIGALRDGLDALLDAADARGVPVWIASGGFDFYIEVLLGPRRPRFARVACNRLGFDGDRMTVDFPLAALACARCAVCKGRVVAEARAVAERVIFAGDGHSDRCAIGVADALAAVRGRSLEADARAAGVACTAFDRLDELIPLLDG